MAWRYGGGARVWRGGRSRGFVGVPADFRRLCPAGEGVPAAGRRASPAEGFPRGREVSTIASPAPYGKQESHGCGLPAFAVTLVAGRCRGGGPARTIAPGIPGRAARRTRPMKTPAGRAGRGCRGQRPRSVGFGRICGNRITSRIAGLSVSSITRRSMPMPQPPVGAGRIRGRGCSRRRSTWLPRRRRPWPGPGPGSGRPGLRVVELGEAVGDLAADDEQLEALGDLGLVSEARASGLTSTG